MPSFMTLDEFKIFVDEGARFFIENSRNKEYKREELLALHQRAIDKITALEEVKATDGKTAKKTYPKICQKGANVEDVEVRAYKTYRALESVLLLYDYNLFSGRKINAELVRQMNRNADYEGLLKLFDQVSFEEYKSSQENGK